MIFVCIGLALFLAMGLPRFINIEEDSTMFDIITGLVMLCLAGKLAFWFKGFYHWSKGKGQSGALTLLGLLGMPIGLIAMAFVKDITPPPINDPFRKCPECGGEYRLGDYNPNAEKIFCSACKTELSGA